MSNALAFVCGILFCVAVLAGENPVVHWRFDDGQGQTLADSAGENHGRIHGAKWIKSGQGHALQFDGVDDYVDCGDGSQLGLRGALTLELWMHPDAPPVGEPGVAGKFYESYVVTYYKTGSAYFYISGGGNGVYGPIRVGEWSHVVGTFDGKMLRFYVNGQEASASASKFDSTNAGGKFLIGVKVGDPGNIDEALRGTEFFTGAVDEVRLYDRALSAEEVVLHYNENAADKGRAPFDTSLLGKLAMRSFVYPDRQQAIAEVNYRWIDPLPVGAQVKVDLLPGSGGEALSSVTLKADTPDRAVEAILPLEGLDDGNYTLRAALLDETGGEKASAEQGFVLPLAQAPVPSPAEKAAGPLPPAYAPPKYQVDVSPSGGLSITVNGQTYPIESSFSFPNAGDNLLSVETPPEAKQEKSWKPQVTQVDDSTWQVRAAGEHYSLERTIKLTPTRVEVSDTLSNTGDDILGVIVNNHVNTSALEGVNHVIPPNPTVFASCQGSGLGLIALDDLYQLQMRTYYAGGKAQMIDEHFGLEKGASYTIEWAAYPTGGESYFDFVNQVRKDEGLNGHVEGSVELSSRWGPPPADAVKNKALKYVSVAYQTNAMDDPHVSIEGWEFMEYPQMQERLRKAIAATRQVYPDLYPMFHVAHTLFATNEPEKKFPDSRALAADGSQFHYGPGTLDYYGNYFTKELFAAGWRWYLFYPTMENSFGKYTLQAADYYINNLGATAIWADGFTGGYIPGEYLYNVFDGHSVDIDPANRTVTRKKAHITFHTLPVLREIVRKFDAAGGVVITNDIGLPRSMWKEHIVTSCETGGGDQQPVGSLYFGHTVTPLGNQVFIKSPRDVYSDILAKLDLGALYFFYAEQNFVTEPTLASHMYPITFDTIQPGTVRGLERIVTKNPGVYGWAGDRSLHAIYATDARGRLVENEFFTTVDADGVRSDLTALKERCASAVVKIPLELTSTGPVNVLVRQYDASGVTIVLNGVGEISLTARDGAFRIAPDAKYVVQRDGQSIEAQLADGLSFTTEINGATTLSIRQP